MSRAATLWTVGILVACWAPVEAGGGGTFPPGTDKAVHLAMFAGFGFLWLRAAPGHLARVVVAGLALAVVTEAVQAWLPFDRSADALDALADGVGLALGVGAARVLRRR